MGRLQGKVAIVTGAATGLGREIAQLYAEQGAQVVLSDVRAEVGNETTAAIVAAGGDATFVQANVRSSVDVRALVEAAERHYGRLDIMTANAGALGRGGDKPLAEMTEDEIDEIVDLNFGGVWRSFMYAIPALRRAGGGAMSVTGSVAGARGNPSQPMYGASKAAINGLVRSLAIDIGPSIRVNVVAPGSMTTEIRAHQAEERGVAHQAAGRMPGDDRYVGHPREVAYVHLFLVSDDAKFVTGQVIAVDGGRSSMLPT